MTIVHEANNPNAILSLTSVRAATNPFMGNATKMSCQSLMPVTTTKSSRQMSNSSVPALSYLGQEGV